MTTRREIEQRRHELQAMFRQAHQQGSLKPGEMVPSVRELAERFQISPNIVRQALAHLVEDGVLHTIPRVGTFVGPPRAQVSEFYLLLLPNHMEEHDFASQLQSGFEQRIAQLGGASLALTLAHAQEHRANGLLPPIAGVFDYAYDPVRGERWGIDSAIPHVGFASWLEDRVHSDVISFDDIDGGRQATQYLMQMGHERIAFLALHQEGKDPGRYLWSAERESGWRNEMQEAGCSTTGLCFHPTREVDYHRTQHIAAGQEVAQALLNRPDITAVVAANDSAALGLLAALREAQVPSERWPALVGFDNMAATNGYMMTSLRLPWEEMGRVAANLLWERRHGQLGVAPEHRRIAMRLIRRLTSQAGWSQMSVAVTFAAETDDSIVKTQ